MRVDLVLEALADDVELALEGERIGAPRWRRRGRRRTGGRPARPGARESPRVESSVGTSRQPRTIWPSSRIIASKRAIRSARCAGVVRQEDEAGAVAALAGSVKPSGAVTLRRKRSGIWTRMPAPSPVLASQPQAPRCSRLRSSSRPCATIECEPCPSGGRRSRRRRRPSRAAGRRVPGPEAAPGVGAAVSAIDGSRKWRCPTRVPGARSVACSSMLVPRKEMRRRRTRVPASRTFIRR